MPTWLISLFSQYGYFAIVVAVLLENAGVPAPGHTLMLAGGALAQQGRLSIGMVIVVGALSAMVGDNIGYWIGRRKGRSFLERYGHWARITPARLEAVDRFFVDHGAKTVFIGRFITGLQTVAALFAGASRMSWWVFFVYNTTGAIAWAATYGLAGYFFGASWSMLEKRAGHAGLFLLASIVLVALVVLALRHRHMIKAKVETYTPAMLLSRGGIIALAALAALGLFIKIAEDVVNYESGTVDRMVSFAVHRLDSPFMDVIMRAFSVVGSFPVILLVIVAVAALCRYRHDRRAFTALLGMMLVDEILNFLLKQLFARPRPNLFAEVASLHSYSFPSGHAMAATAIYGMTAVVLARLMPRLRRPLAVGTPILIALIGFSRIFLGVHWVTDILAGFAAGSFLLLAGVYWLGRKDDGPG